MVRVPLLFTLLCALVLAGCASPTADVTPPHPNAGQTSQPADATPPTSANATSAASIVTKAAFDWDAGVSAPGTPFYQTVVLGSQANSFSFEVPKAAAAATVDAAWTCPAPTCPVDFYLNDGGTVNVGPGGLGPEPDQTGDGSVHFVLQHPKPGTYSILIEPDYASAQVQGTITATITA